MANLTPEQRKLFRRIKSLAALWGLHGYVGVGAEFGPSREIKSITIWGSFSEQDKADLTNEVRELFDGGVFFGEIIRFSHRKAVS